MVVRLRLQRFGMRNHPFYRIVAADSRFPRDGRFIERLGWYNPIPMKDNVKEIVVNSERTKYWLAVGAQPSDRVAWLLGKVGVLPPAVPRDMSEKKVPKMMLEKKKK